jgi:uncharacterized membrane protein YeaQ/YmgE (transglycosylase-associated protein family)
MEILWWLIVGLIAGALAGRVVSGHGYGVLGDIVVGLLGALIGGFLAHNVLGLDASGVLGSLLVAFLGAVLLLIVWRAIAPRRALL